MNNKKPYRVLLDGSGITLPGKGVARVQINLLTRLLKREEGVEYFIVVRRGVVDAVMNSENKISGAKIVEIKIRSQLWWSQITLPRLAKSLQVDQIYTQVETPPFWGPPCICHIFEDPEKRYLIPRLVKESWKKEIKQVIARWIYQMLWRKAVSRANKIVTSTNVIRMEIAKKLNISDDTINVLPLGVDRNVFYPVHVEKVIPKVKIAEPYLFHLGSKDARDLTTEIILAYDMAYKIAIKTGVKLPTLIVGGEITNSLYSSVRNVDKLLRESQIRFLGRLTDEELCNWMGRALFCVQPSLYEGFGLTVLEEMACGTPVIVFKEQTTIEVAGESVYYASENSIDSLANAIVSLYFNSNLREQLIGLAFERLKDFEWDIVSEKLHNLIWAECTK
jgi:glycosyltransferase involved in cell wall biosynthesis